MSQSTEPKQTQAIAFQYPCYICKEVFNTAVDVKSHVICVHYFVLPELKLDAGKTRPTEDNLEFKKLPPSNEDSKDLVIHFACPSCWYHCPAGDVLELEVHIKDVHNPDNLHKVHNEGESSVASPGKKQRTATTLEDLNNKLDELNAFLQSYLDHNKEKH